MRTALRFLAFPLAIAGLGIGQASAQQMNPPPGYQQPGYQQPGYQQPGYQQPPAVIVAPAAPAQSPPPSSGKGFTPQEIIDAGHGFFGTVSRGLATVVEKATAQWGQPNGYILGEEASGAFVGGLRYGEGKLYTKNAGDLRVYWQGPTVGFDWGGDGARTMMLVYNLPATEAVYQRFAGIDGSAYFIGGFGMTALTANNVVVVPIRSGVGMRLGANIGYLKFTPSATWNPF